MFAVPRVRHTAAAAKLIVHSDNCNGIAKPKNVQSVPVSTTFIDFSYPESFPVCSDEKLRSENNLFIYLSVFVPWLASVTGTGAASMRCYIGNCSTFEECRRPELVADCPNDQAYDACLSTIVQKGINLYLSFYFYQLSLHLSL